MNVTLISHQEDALDILLYTKNTRLRGEYTLADIKAWPMAKKMEHLAYMKDTIKSSWEFATYVFEIEGVTRAFTHQLVRTRNASYAQESLRAVDISESAIWLTPEGPEELTRAFDIEAHRSISTYADLVEAGMPPGDARGILPTNVLTSIIMGANLRTLAQMAEIRLCTKTQGEYQNVFREIVKRVVEVHPWTEEFLQVYCANHGTCAFPRYTQCPIQRHTCHGTNQDLYKEVAKREWSKTRHEAKPLTTSEGVATYGG